MVTVYITPEDEAVAGSPCFSSADEADEDEEDEDEDGLGVRIRRRAFTKKKSRRSAYRRVVIEPSALSRRHTASPLACLWRQTADGVRGSTRESFCK